ncbi:phosphate acyltransferase PlsX, partial [bacterium]|nr:phosphate acyltransferase PlsX [bacterium]
SMRVCFDLHKKGLADGVVSAGNSGAMLAIGRHVLKMIPGIDRPCISALLPSINRKVLLLDAGANVDCTPETLLQFAFLGSVYMEHIHSIKTPRIGLLNIGSEEGKGDERSRITYKLLKSCPLNFVGNVEGKEFFKGEIDVVVTDGFAGNILLKSVQGAADFVKEILKEEIRDSLVTRIVGLYLKPTLLRLKKRTDYAEFGGAPLLGLKGNSIVCHGGSNPRALAFGISFADWASKAQLEKRMEEKILEYQEILKNKG